MIPHKPTSGDLLSRDELVRRTSVEMTRLMRRLAADLEHFTCTTVDGLQLVDRRPGEPLEVVITARAIDLDAGEKRHG
jgi:hypothetical protein